MHSSLWLCSVKGDHWLRSVNKGLHYKRQVIQIYRCQWMSHMSCPLVLTEKAHTTKSHHHTPQRTCLSSHLLVGLGVSPRSLLLLGRQMEAHEVMELWNLALEGLRVTLACQHVLCVLEHRCAYTHRVRTRTHCNPETLNTVVKCNMHLLLCRWYNKQLSYSSSRVYKKNRMWLFLETLSVPVSTAGMAALTIGTTQSDRPAPHRQMGK